MRVSKATIAAAIILAVPSLVLAPAHAASECPVAGMLSTWGINSAGIFNVASGDACLFPLRLEGVIAHSSILLPPEHGTLRQLNESTFEYTSSAGYIGP